MLYQVESMFDDMEKKMRRLKKQKYEENDKEWRQKYRDRFFSGQPAKEEEEFEGEDEDPRTKYTYEKLFKEVTE